MACAAQGRGLYGAIDVAPVQKDECAPSHTGGAMHALIMPFVVLFIGIVGIYVSDGVIGGDWSVLAALANSAVAIQLKIGGVAALVVAGYYCVPYTKSSGFLEGLLLSEELLLMIAAKP